MKAHLQALVYYLVFSNSKCALADSRASATTRPWSLSTAADGWMNKLKSYSKFYYYESFMPSVTSKEEEDINEPVRRESDNNDEYTTSSHDTVVDAIGSNVASTIHQCTDETSDIVTKIRGGSAGLGGGKAATTAPVTFDSGAAKAALKSACDVGRYYWNAKIVPMIHDPSTHIVQPVQDFLYNQTQAAQTRREAYKRRGTAATVLFCGPTRLLQLCLASWLCGEILASTGVFGDVNAKECAGKVLPGKLQSAWYSAKDFWTQMWGTGSMSIGRAFHDIEAWAPKYQFALGAGIGLVLSPIAIPVGKLVAKLSIAAYLLGEINYRFAKAAATREGVDIMFSWRELRAEYRLKDAPGSIKGDLSDFGDHDSDWLTGLENALEWWRLTVRHTIKDPMYAMDSVQVALMTTFHDGVLLAQRIPLTPTIQRGLLSGIVAGIVVGA